MAAVPMAIMNWRPCLFFLNYGDQLDFTLRTDNQILIECENPELTTQDNLIFKAARLLQNHANITQGITIKLTKKVTYGRWCWGRLI